MIRRVLATMLLLVSACGDEGGHFPINPGGGGGGSSMSPDGGVDGDAGTTITGRVCVLGDPRSLTACASSGADGITVALGNKTATTASSGAFVIDRPTGTNLVWRVSGPGIEPSALPLASSATIPAVDSIAYDDMLAATNAIVSSANGAIIARVANGATPVANITAVATPQSDSDVYYDGPSITEWEFDGTGAGGIVWIPSIATGSASLALDSGTAQRTVTNIPIFADTITFAYAAAP